MIPTNNPNPLAPLPTAGAAAQNRGELSVAELQQTIASLRWLFQITLVGLILLLAAVNLYLFSHGRAIRQQAYELNRQVLEMRRAVDDYTTNSVPWLNRFTTELRRFANTHPDFAQILDRYPKPDGATSPAAVGSVPAAVLPSKK